ncbi:MAG: FitA-like ribbon-helix-helix domain-containing protein [Burkholderiales bacterium]
MSVTLTIKRVPERIAQKLRARAAASHRSLQDELMLILHDAVAEPPATGERERPSCPVKRLSNRKRMPAHGRRLTLREIWERSRWLGSKSPSESAAIVRGLRDERHRR